MKNIWSSLYQVTKEKLENFPKIGGIVSAWNANIDAVVKLSGKRIENLLEKYNQIYNSSINMVCTPEDLLRGLIKCFKDGIAEEWIVENEEIFLWMKNNIGYDKLQMGGQGGIIANTAAICGVNPVFVHCASLPKMQADLFLDLDNLVSFDTAGKEQKACNIDRKEDLPLIHWILEFDKGDEIHFNGEHFICPKSNRFIATYDPLNLLLHIDESFNQGILHTEKNINFIFLAGYHLLKETLYNGERGIDEIQKSMQIIKNWKEKHKNCLVHFEFASTQDLVMRKAMLELIAKHVDSLGCNERELIDILEVMNESELYQACMQETTSVNLFQGLIKLFKYLNIPRIQLHMFGLYITLSQKNALIPPINNRNGMMTAATLAATKAGTGSLYDKDNLLWAYGQAIGDASVKELTALSDFITKQYGQNELLNTGIATFQDFDIIAVPTIIIDKPLTLVGMGDTISSISLLAAKA